MTAAVGADPPEDHLPRLDPDRFSFENRRRLSGAGLRTFVAIADLWRLTTEQRRIVLGMPARSTYRAWLRAAREHREMTLDGGVLMRISAVLGIHQALGILHKEGQQDVAWLRGPHGSAVFGGRAPLDLVVDGTLDGPMTVRRVLDGLLQGQAMEPNTVDTDFRPYATADIVMS